MNQCFIKAKKAIVLHPKSNLELKYVEASNIGFNCWRELLDNEIMMKIFQPFIPFLKKISIKLDFKESLKHLVRNRYKFEALECLDLDVSKIDHTDNCMQGVPFKRGRFNYGLQDLNFDFPS